MTKTTLTLLFTAAMLAGLAAAPSAQTFRWRAGDNLRDAHERIRERVERSLERTRTRQERRADAVDRDILANINASLRRGRFRYDMRRHFPRGAFGNHAPGTQAGFDLNPCESTGRWSTDDAQRVCDVRESTLGGGALGVDAGRNGGIAIEAWDRNDIRIRAIVVATARDAARAKAIASEVQVQLGGGRVTTTGPDVDRRESWSVSYRINVPKRTDLDLHGTNGGISITGVNGNLRFDTLNGGVKLEDVGGRVNGETHNGGVTVALAGDRFDGEGVDVKTRNGGVILTLPEGYNAQLDARTVNGGISVDFPVTVRGELNSRRGLSTTLGSGGPAVRLQMTNGGVKISRR